MELLKSDKEKTSIIVVEFAYILSRIICGLM